MYHKTAENLALRFGGEVEKQDRCEVYLKPEHTFLFGLSFKNAKSNFKLLNKYDMANLGVKSREACKRTKCSPFEDLLLIVYKDAEGVVVFKLLNGMAGVLVEEMARFCKNENLRNAGL